MPIEKPSITPVAVITGGGRGIGASYCLDLAAAGFDVVVADILDEGNEVAERIHVTTGREVMFVKVDVTVEESTRAMASAVTERFGRVDALVNNAALYQALGNKRPFTDIGEDEWDKVMAVNVKGLWHVAKSLYPQMEKAGYGRIVNIASSTVHMGAPGFPHYVASKGAVIALTRSLAREVGVHGVTVNCVAPGLVHNDSSVVLNGEDYFATSAQQRAIPRSMEEQDLFGAVRFLTSKASGFVTGQTVIVDGGQAFS